MTIESLEGMTVLLVDDESFSRKLVARMLSDMGRPAVIEAEDGERALAILAEHQVDLIVSDFNMPKVHGLQLLRSVRAGQTQSRRDMPFAMLTGYSERKLVDMALALGINAFLIKPVSSDGLKRRLTLMLSHDQEDGWLKDEATYQAVDVDGTLDKSSNRIKLATVMLCSISIPSNRRWSGHRDGPTALAPSRCAQARQNNPAGAVLAARI